MINGGILLTGQVLIGYEGLGASAWTIRRNFMR